MSQKQRHRSNSRSALEAEVAAFIENPITLPAHVVRAILDELTGELGMCLTAQDYETIEADPPRDPQAFTELVLNLDGLGAGDHETALPVLQRVLKTFQGARASGWEVHVDHR